MVRMPLIYNCTVTLNLQLYIKLQRIYMYTCFNTEDKMYGEVYNTTNLSVMPYSLDSDQVLFIAGIDVRHGVVGGGARGWVISRLCNSPEQNAVLQCLTS